MNLLVIDNIDFDPENPSLSSAGLTDLLTVQSFETNVITPFASCLTEGKGKEPIITLIVPKALRLWQLSEDAKIGPLSAQVLDSCRRAFRVLLFLTSLEMLPSVKPQVIDDCKALEKAGLDPTGESIFHIIGRGVLQSEHWRMPLQYVIQRHKHYLDKLPIISGFRDSLADFKEKSFDDQTKLLRQIIEAMPECRTIFDGRGYVTTKDDAISHLQLLVMQAKTKAGEPRAPHVKEADQNDLQVLVVLAKLAQETLDPDDKIKRANQDLKVLMSEVDAQKRANTVNSALEALVQSGIREREC